MAYPAALTAPFTYGTNWKAVETRQHKNPNRFRFGAGTDGEAGIIAGHLDAAVTGQQTSLVKRVGQHNLNAAHPAGSRYSVSFILKDSTGAVWRQQLRNWVVANPSDYAAALWTGIASADTHIAALSAAPSLPNSGGAITVVTYTVVNKG